MPMDEIEIIKQRLIEQVNPTCIYLFGSFANGTAHADSDLDFYIIVDDGEKDLHAIAASAHKAIRDVKQHPVDILVGTKKRLCRAQGSVHRRKRSIAQRNSNL